ncbi:MAG: type II secretion system F family protein [Treponemataceae bacterium]|nr:type II secretion system F family protein [Treponemataceae bacterium]
MRKDSFEEYCRLCIPLLKSGYAVSRAAVVISKMSTAPRDVLSFSRYLIFMMQTGCSFTYAAERYYTGLRKTGYGALFQVFEVTGNLQRAMELYVSQGEKSSTLKRKLYGALLYPALVILGLLVLCLFLALNRDLFGFAAGIDSMYRTLAKAAVFFACWLTGFTLWLGRVFRINQKEQFFRIMAAALLSKTDLITCLRLCAVSQASLAPYLAQVSQLLQKGYPLVTALQQQKPFRHDDFSLLEAAGDSLQLAEAFHDCAERLERKNSERQERTMNMIEPVLLSGVGAVLLMVTREAILPYLTSYGAMI